MEIERKRGELGKKEEKKITLLRVEGGTEREREQETGFSVGREKIASSREGDRVLRKRDGARIFFHGFPPKNMRKIIFTHFP